MLLLLSACGHPPELRARRAHRSLSQQALMDLQEACGGVRVSGVDRLLPIWPLWRHNVMVLHLSHLRKR